MDQNIWQQITKIAHQFEMAAGRKPTDVYAGYDEQYQMKTSEIWLHLVGLEITRSNRPLYYDGMEIHFTYGESHLAVGWRGNNAKGKILKGANYAKV